MTGYFGNQLSCQPAILANEQRPIKRSAPASSILSVKDKANTPDHRPEQFILADK
jgi:hypothetical protein